MARVAIDRGMGSGEREAVVVILNLLIRNLPSPNGVALFAIRPELPPVNICVAILAALPHVREHRFHVALRTGHGTVHPAQRVLRLIVVEFWHGSNRFPCICRVAVLARQIQVSVRTVRPARNLCPGTRRQSSEYQNGNSKRFEVVPSTPHKLAPYWCSNTEDADINANNAEQQFSVQRGYRWWVRC